MSTAIANTMSARGATLLGAMRRNLELLVELEKSDPAAVSAIVAALVAHLRSWKPLAAVAVSPPLETAPVVPIGARSSPPEVTVDLGGGAFYELRRVAENALGVYMHDETGHDSDTALDRAKGATFVENIAKLLAQLPAPGDLAVELWFVRYAINGVEHRAGPWPWNEAVEHRRDIANYEGVSDVDYEQEGARHG